MTHPSFKRLPLLLLLTLTALTGCDPKPPPTPGQNYSEVQFDVTVPLETPVDATLLLTGEDPAFKGLSGQGLELTYQGGTTFTVKARMPKDQPLTYTLRMTAPSEHVALDAAGTAVPARTLEAHWNEENVSFSVERWGPESGVTQPQTVFVAAVPETTPPEDGIWLSGNHELLGNWNGAGVKLYKAVNSGHATVLSFAPDTSLEFKATRGSWETVEKTAAGAEVSNHSHKTGSGFQRVSLSVGGWADFVNVPPEPTTTGNVEYLRDVTPTNTLLKKRDIIIWLPPDYETNTAARYPVLYMHDGQNLMDAATAFAGGEWKVDETAGQLVESGEVEPVIIVGVYNAGVDRIAEYTQVEGQYTENGVVKTGGGRADDYGRFLVEELKPLIDSKYRTKPEAQYTGLAGSSLGGLVSMYLGMKYPETFSRLGVVSPSVWWANKDILSKVDALTAKPPLRIWVDIGTAEAGSSTTDVETVADTDALVDRLKNKGWVLDNDLKYTVVDGGKHNEAAWAARFGDILKYLFPPSAP